MKKYNIDKKVKENKRIKKQGNRLLTTLKNILPGNTKELRECIIINNLTNKYNGGF